MVLLIGGVLFNDGKGRGREEVWKLRGGIVVLGLGVVFGRVIVGGYTMDWMIGRIGLGGGFVVGGI
uniref:hypothetical protein n=1 Tax=Bacillus altitudinis TaxID=293387 RepID=UPI0011AA665B